MKLYFTKHAIQRMFERSIPKPLIEGALKNGEKINEYPDDKPYPSKLLLYFFKKTPLHIVFSVENKDGQDIFIIITVYEPSHEEWNDDFKTRRIK